MVCTGHRTVFGRSNEGELDRACSTHGTAYISRMERDCLQNLVIDGKITLKLIFQEWDGRACIGVSWPKKGISGALL